MHSQLMQLYPVKWKYCTYSLIMLIVSPKFLVIGILNINWLIVEVRCSRSVVVHHRNSSIYGSHFQKCLQPIHRWFQSWFCLQEKKASFFPNSTLTRKRFMWKYDTDFLSIRMHSCVQIYGAVLFNLCVFIESFTF